MSQFKIQFTIIYTRSKMVANSEKMTETDCNRAESLQTGTIKSIKLIKYSN